MYFVFCFDSNWFFKGPKNDRHPQKITLEFRKLKNGFVRA